MADETPAPLSDAEIERIRRAVEDRQYQPDRVNTVTLQIETMRRLLTTLDAYNEVRGLALADIARLAIERDAARSTLTAMREIVAAVAKMDDWWFVDVEEDADGVPQRHPCPHCAVDMNLHSAQHVADCPVTRARALLATQTPGATVEGDPAVCASCGKPAVIHDSGDPYCAQCYHDATGEWPGTTGATGATAAIQSQTEPDSPSDHTHEWKATDARFETTDDEGHYHKWYRTRCIRCGLIWEHS